MERRSAPVSEPRGAHRDVAAVSLAVVLLLGVALVKPWGQPKPGGTIETGPSPSASVAVELTTSPTPITEESLVRGFCLQPSGWRIFTTEHWTDHDIRVWRSAEGTADAIDAADSRIPMTPVASRSVTTLGFCAPVSGPERPPRDATVALYRVDPGGQPRLLAARRVQPVERPSPLGTVFSPPLSKNVDVDEHNSWPSGVYVFRVGGERAGYVRWVGATIDILAAPSPATPAVAPTPATEN